MLQEWASSETQGAIYRDSNLYPKIKEPSLRENHVFNITALCSDLEDQPYLTLAQEDATSGGVANVTMNTPRGSGRVNTQDLPVTFHHRWLAAGETHR